MAVSTGTLPVQTTEPDVIRRHNISDEELGMLCEGRKDMVLEFLWVAIGVLVGAFPSAVTAMVTYANPPESYKLPLDDLIQIVLFWMAAAMTIVLAIVATKRGNRAKTLQDDIRSRSPRSL